MEDRGLKMALDPSRVILYRQSSSLCSPLCTLHFAFSLTLHSALTPCLAPPPLPPLQLVKAPPFAFGRFARPNAWRFPSEATVQRTRSKSSRRAPLSGAATYW